MSLKYKALKDSAENKDMQIKEANMTEDIDVDTLSLVCSESEDEFESCSDYERDMMFEILCKYEIN